MTERSLYPLFSHYIRDFWTQGSAVFELKICKGTRLNLKELKEHQERALSMASENSIYYKISDQSQGQKPFDCFFLQRIPAYVVICFYTKGFYPAYFIDIFEWRKFKAHGAKSITEEECKQICTSWGMLTQNRREPIAIS